MTLLGHTTPLPILDNGNAACHEEFNHTSNKETIHIRIDHMWYFSSRACLVSMPAILDLLTKIQIMWYRILYRNITFPSLCSLFFLESYRHALIYNRAHNRQYPDRLPWGKREFLWPPQQSIIHWNVPKWMAIIAHATSQENALKHGKAIIFMVICRIYLLTDVIASASVLLNLGIYLLNRSSLHKKPNTTWNEPSNNLRKYHIRYRFWLVN